MKIIGIDPGTAIAGYAVIEKSKPQLHPRGVIYRQKRQSDSNKNLSGLKVIDFGVITTRPGLGRGERLGLVYKGICDIIGKVNPDIFAIEELFFFKNGKTVISVAEARGVAILAAEIHKLPIFEYTPLQVKQAITGFGRADKPQMQKMIKMLLGLDEIPKPDDAADALAIAVCCANSIKSEYRNPKS